MLVVWQNFLVHHTHILPPKIRSNRCCYRESPRKKILPGFPGQQQQQRQQRQQQRLDGEKKVPTINSQRPLACLVLPTRSYFEDALGSCTVVIERKTVWGWRQWQWRRRTRRDNTSEQRHFTLTKETSTNVTHKIHTMQFWTIMSTASPVEVWQKLVKPRVKYQILVAEPRAQEC